MRSSLYNWSHALILELLKAEGVNIRKSAFCYQNKQLWL